MPVVRVNDDGKSLSKPQRKIRTLSLASSSVCVFCSALALLAGMTVEGAYFVGLAAAINSCANLIISPL